MIFPVLGVHLATFTAFWIIVSVSAAKHQYLVMSRYFPRDDIDIANDVGIPIYHKLATA